MVKVAVVDMTHKKLKPLVEYETEHIPRIGESWTWGPQYRVKDIHWLRWGKLAEQGDVKVYVEEV